MDGVAKSQIGAQHAEIRLVRTGCEGVEAVSKLVAAQRHGIVPRHVHKLKQRTAAVHVAGGRRPHGVPAVQHQDRVSAGTVMGTDHRRERDKAALFRRIFGTPVPCLVPIVETVLGVDTAP